MFSFPMSHSWKVVPVGASRGLVAALLGLQSLMGPSAHAADAVRGAQLYLQLPSGDASCVACHGADPAANRNRLLGAAGQAVILQKALNAVGVMGYLKPLLTEVDVADLSAYLDSVARAAAIAADGGPQVWPRSIEFGTLAAGAASPTHTVWLRHRGSVPLTDVAPRLAGGRFLLTHDCPAVLQPGALCSAQLRALAPPAGESVSDALLWGGASPARIGLSATGSGGLVATLVADAATIDFGGAAVDTPVTRRLRLSNAGNAATTLTTATLTGPTAPAFALTAGCMSGTVLGPGESCTADIVWRPGAAVAYEAALQWRSDGTRAAPLRLQAQGLAPPPTQLPPASGPTVSEPGGGGGCAAAPPSWRGGDASLLLWAGLAACFLGRRRGLRRGRVQTSPRTVVTL